MADSKELLRSALQAMPEESRTKVIQTLRTTDRKAELANKIINLHQKKSKTEAPKTETSKIDVEKADPYIGRTLKGFFAPTRQAARLGLEATGYKPPGAELSDRAVGREARGVFEGATSGLARGAFKYTGKDIGQGGVVGRIAGTIMVPGSIANKVAKRLIKGVGVWANAGRGAISGAVDGFLVPLSDDPFDVYSRSLQAAAGASFGSTLGAIGGVALKFKEAKDAKNVIKQIKRQKQQLKRQEITRGIKFSKRSQRAKAVEDILKPQEKALKAEAKKSIDNQIKKTYGEMIDAADQAVLKNRQKMAQGIRKGKKVWGQKFDDLIESSDVDSVPYKEFVEDTFGKTIGELEVREIKVDAGTKNKIIEFMKKYDPQQAGTGNIPIKELVKLRREVAESLSSGFKSGSFDVEDMTALIFNRRLSGKLEETVDGLSDLNNSYREILDQADFVYKNFKPQAAGESMTKTGINVLKKIGLGDNKISPDDLRQIMRIEKGTDFIPGIGDFTSGIKSIGKRVQALKSIKPEAAKKAASKVQAKLNQARRIKSKITQKTKELSDAEKLQKLNLDEKIQSAQDVLEGLGLINKYGSYVAFQIVDIPIKIALYKLLTRE